MKKANDRVFAGLGFVVLLATCCRPQEGRADSGHGVDIGRNMITSWHGPELRQSYTAVGFRDVVLREETLDASTGTWKAEYYTGSSAFDIRMLASSGKDYFFLAGVDDLGQVVIERWRLAPAKFQIPGAPPPPKTLKRTELFRGALESPVVDIEVDPERRFLLLLVENDLGERLLYRFPVQVGSTPTLLYDEASLPDLHTMWTMSRMEHSSLGRIWILSDAIMSSGPARVIVLVDSDNDGYFEGTPIIDWQSSAYSPGGFLFLSNWVDTFKGPLQ